MHQVRLGTSTTLVGRIGIVPRVQQGLSFFAGRMITGPALNVVTVNGRVCPPPPARVLATYTRPDLQRERYIPESRESASRKLWGDLERWGGKLVCQRGAILSTKVPCACFAKPAAKSNEFGGYQTIPERSGGTKCIIAEHV